MSAAEAVETVEPDVDVLPDDTHWICCLPESLTALCGVTIESEPAPDAPYPVCETCNELHERDRQLPALPDGRCALCPHNVLGGAP